MTERICKKQKHTASRILIVCILCNHIYVPRLVNDTRCPPLQVICSKLSFGQSRQAAQADCPVSSQSHP